MQLHVSDGAPISLALAQPELGRACGETHLELEDVVDLLEFLLVPVRNTHTSVTQLYRTPMAPNGASFTP